MLHLTIKKGENVIIGDDISVTYDRNDGKAIVALKVNAPRDMKIVRGKLYEERIAEKASSGDRNAMRLLEQIIEENAERRKIFNQRKAKRQYHASRTEKKAQ